MLTEQFRNEKTRITKINKLLSVRNDWCCNDYYLVYGRIYYNDRQYQKIKFVLTFDIMEDTYDYFYDDNLTEEENLNRTYTQKDIKEAVNSLATLTFESFEYQSMEDTIAWCNDTIHRYNRQ